MKYSIIHVNDRCINQINHNKKVLKNFEYIDKIQYFDGNLHNGHDVLNDWGIPLNVWSPYDGRSNPPLPGEYGIWVSIINALKYIVDNNIDKMLLLEDDIVLNKNFVSNLKKAMMDLPENYDFLSLYYFEGHNWLDEKTDIGSKYIHKSYNQYSAGQAMVYSYKGAKKLLKAIKRKGIEYTSDCFIYRQALEGVVDGYSMKPNVEKMIFHDYIKVKSLIDPTNIREVEM